MAGVYLFYDHRKTDIELCVFIDTLKIAIVIFGTSLECHWVTFYGEKLVNGIYIRKFYCGLEIFRLPRKVEALGGRLRSFGGVLAG